MKIKEFELSDINDYRLFYRLQKFSWPDSFEIYHREVDGLQPFDDYMVLNISGIMVVSIPDQFKHTGKYNLVATNGEKSEIINIHPFERVWNYYKLGHNGDNPGAFTFLNSLPAMDFERNWRCDHGFFGPEIFSDPTGASIIDVPSTLDGIIVYEPLLSINGVAHLVYAERTNKDNRHNMLNNTYTPFASQTFGGAIKLITEWSDMANEPFNNDEDIAAKAKIFCDELAITKDLVINQPDMQIYRYVKGEEYARQSPMPVMFSEDLSTYLKTNMAHSCFSSLLVLFPEISVDLDVVIELEKQIVEYDLNEFLNKIIRDSEINYYDRDAVLSHIDSQNYPPLSAFSRLKLGFLDIKKQMILHIEENRQIL